MGCEEALNFYTNTYIYICVLYPLQFISGISVWPDSDMDATRLKFRPIFAAGPYIYYMRGSVE